MGTPYSQGDNIKLVRHIISRLLVRVCFRKLATSKDSRTTLVKFMGVKNFWENPSLNDNRVRNMSKYSILHSVIKSKLGYPTSCQQIDSKHSVKARLIVKPLSHFVVLLPLEFQQVSYCLDPWNLSEVNSAWYNCDVQSLHALQFPSKRG